MAEPTWLQDLWNAIRLSFGMKRAETARARPAARPAPEPSPPPAALDEDDSPADRTMDAIAGLAAKVAKADGRVSREELAVAEDIFREELNLYGDAWKRRARFFDRTRRGGPSAYALADAVRRAGDEGALELPAQELKEEILDALVRVAYADGRLHPGAELLLRRISRTLGLADPVLAATLLRRKPAAKKPEEPRRDPGAGARPPRPRDPLQAEFDLLGLDPRATRKQARKRWLRLAKELHPDRVRAGPAGSPAQRAATARFQALHAAYAAVCRARAWG